MTRRLITNSGSLLSDETDLVIEGFPRSGNTFAVVAFTAAQRRQVSVAHHVHAPGQVLEAVRRGIPCLLLVREPEDAVLSFALRLPDLSLRQALRAYVRFHVPLLRVRRDVVVARFEDVTSDFGRVIERVNDAFGTSFAPFEHTPENVERVMREVDAWDAGAFEGDPSGLERGRARPTAARSTMKDALRERYASGGLASLRRRAEGAYRSLAGVAR